MSSSRNSTYRTGGTATNQLDSKSRKYSSTEAKSTRRATKKVRGTANREHSPEAGTHVNYAWRSLDAVAFERLPPGDVLVVSAPNNRQPITSIPSEYVLVTRGSMQHKVSHKPLSHCAHYFFNRRCERGERCNFIHAVHVDSSAKDWQRAPGHYVARNAMHTHEADERSRSHNSLHEVDDERDDVFDVAPYGRDRKDAAPLFEVQPIGELSFTPDTVPSMSSRGGESDSDIPANAALSSTATQSAKRHFRWDPYSSICSVPC